MSFWDDFVGLFRGRRAPPRLPDPQPRRDSGGGGGSVVNAFTGLGGSNDKGVSAAPNVYRQPLSDEQLEALYRFNGLAAKIVDYFPKRATRKAWEVPDIGSEDKRLRVRTNVRDGMKWARLHGNGVVALITEDDVPPGYRKDPRRWLEQPLDLKRVGKLHALQAFDVWEASPHDWDRDPRSNNFRMPSAWSIHAEGFSGILHHSRVLVFRGRRRGSVRRWWGHQSVSNLPDDSELQRMWDEIRRLTSVMQGGAVLAEELKQNVLKIGDLGALSTGDDANKFEQRMGLMQRTLALLGIAVIGPNDEFDMRSTPATGFGELSEAGKDMLSAVSDISRVSLFGQAPGGLSTDGESHKEDDRQAVAAYQDDNRDPLEQLYQVVYAAQDGPTDGKVPDEWELQFKPLDEPREIDVAQVREMMARVDQMYIEMGVYTERDVAAQRFNSDGDEWQIDLTDIEPPDPSEQAILEGVRDRLRVLKGGPLMDEPGGQPGGQPYGETDGATHRSLPAAP